MHRAERSLAQKHNNNKKIIVDCRKLHHMKLQIHSSSKQSTAMMVKISSLFSSAVFVLSTCTKVDGFLSHQTFAIPPLQTVSYRDNNPTSTTTSSLNYLTRVSSSRNSLPSKNDHNDNEVMESSTVSFHSSLTSRRSFFQNAEMTASSIGLLSFYPQSSVAVEENDKLTLYTDKTCGFQMKVPSSWERSEQSLPDRRKIVLYIDGSSGDGNDDKNLIFIAYTPVRDDFTSLSSFGSVDQVGMTLLDTFRLSE